MLRRVLALPATDLTAQAACCPERNGAVLQEPKGEIFKKMNQRVTAGRDRGSDSAAPGSTQGKKGSGEGGEDDKALGAAAGGAGASPPPPSLAGFLLPLSRPLARTAERRGTNRNDDASSLPCSVRLQGY